MLVGALIIFSTLLWDANQHSQAFSAMYDETWVEKLYRGFARNTTQPFRFVCYVDRLRSFGWPIEQVQMKNPKPGYGDCIQPYELGEPMILVGLDTIITGNIDHLAEYCFTHRTIALPRDPYKPVQACNGVALVPAGHRHVWTDWRGENDMEHMRRRPHVFIDDEFPGHVVSYKGHVEKHGLGDARIVYFHGRRKPHELGDGWIKEHWNNA